MATLVLTAVGTLVGGPIGGAIGALFGQQIDQAVFAPKGRHGPRLGNLAVQTSSYGTDIPKIFGTMRVAGTVIWATDLIETRSTSGGGKGKPKTTNYSYSANFAVALSGRPITGIGRIWADGKLLRGAAGDFKTATHFRLHLGGEDQLVDPLVASAEGGNAPAFRGVAYAVFENFQLEDYGNRIPSLTFEVTADPGGISIGAIARTLADDAIEGGGTIALAGYAALGDSVRSALEPVVDIAGLPLSDRQEGALRLGLGDGVPRILPRDQHVSKLEIARRAARVVPSELTIAYYDLARDYQTGLHRAAIGDAAVHHAERHNLPAALSSAHAKGLAEQRLEDTQAARTESKAMIGWRHAAVRPGDIVSCEGAPGRWQIRRWTLERGTLTLELQRIASAFTGEPPLAEAGGGAAEPDIAHGPTSLRVMDLPLGDPPGGRPLLFVAAAGIAPGWRRANVLASYTSGLTWTEAGSTAPEAIFGTALTSLGAAGHALFDRAGHVEVELLNAEMWLEGASDAALAAGTNLALLGDELIQFGEAMHLSGRRFRLSRLLRGRRGTEWAIAGHEAGEDFTLIERDALLTIEAPDGSLGAVAQISASGVGDDDPVTRSCLVAGASLQPPAPVHLDAKRGPDGGLAIVWTRRSRLGWTWADAETPLGEERESYLVTVSGETGTRTMTTSAPHCLYPLAEQAADGIFGPLTIKVVQVGTYARSRSAMISID